MWKWNYVKILTNGNKSSSMAIDTVLGYGIKRWIWAGIRLATCAMFNTERWEKAFCCHKVNHKRSVLYLLTYPSTSKSHTSHLCDHILFSFTEEKPEGLVTFSFHKGAFSWIRRSVLLRIFVAIRPNWDRPWNYTIWIEIKASESGSEIDPCCLCLSWDFNLGFDVYSLCKDYQFFKGPLFMLIQGHRE